MQSNSTGTSVAPNANSRLRRPAVHLTDSTATGPLMTYQRSWAHNPLQGDSPMADDKKTLEMRVAELEDKLAQVHITEDEMATYNKVAAKLGGAQPCQSC